MLSLSRLKFIGIIVSFFIIANLFFASLYYLIGVENLIGIYCSSEQKKFGQAYSLLLKLLQPLVTVTQARKDFLTITIATTEVLFGFLAFALATALIHGDLVNRQCILNFLKTLYCSF